MRVLVCGGRTFNDRELLVKTLDPLYWGQGMNVLIEGEAPGADKMSSWWAEAYDIEIIKFPANWRKYGKTAGFIRNKQMLDEGKPTMVVAFPGGVGTAMMVKLAKNRGIEVMEVS